MSSNTKRINPNISVDCVIFGFDGEQLNVLLVNRTLTEKDTGDIIFNDQTLAGNHIFEHEDIDEAAYRILYDLTGLKNIFLEQFGAFAQPKRLAKLNDQLWLTYQGKDPQNRIISVGYFALIATKDVTLEWKGRNVLWTPVTEVRELAFDHNKILSSALTALRSKLLHAPIGFELLPQKFTLTQVQKVYEAILGSTLDKRNFRKKISRMKYLIPLDEKQKGVAHKPAQLFIFSREVYEKTKSELFDFSI